MKPADRYRYAGIIPARYASTRFPGKPLALIGDKPMIQRVYEQASQSLDLVYVATDDQRIFDAVVSFGGKAVMTSEAHQSGTDRCAEATGRIAGETGMEPEIVINIQGDEPFVKPSQIELLKSCFNDATVEIATLIRKVQADEPLDNPNHPKVVVDTSGNAIYFSRSVIPFVRDALPGTWHLSHTFFKHIGLYAYSTRALREITLLPRSPLEKAESLEQNRWIENGYRIRTAVTEWESIGIDTPEDLEKAVRFYYQIK